MSHIWVPLECVTLLCPISGYPDMRHALMMSTPKHEQKKIDVWGKRNDWFHTRATCRDFENDSQTYDGFHGSLN